MTYSRLHPPRRRQKRAPKPDYKGKVVIAQRKDGEKTLSVTMAAAEVARQFGRQKGGQRLHELGKAHRFDSEGAQKAANKLWSTRQRKVRGIRIGTKSRRRQRVNRKDLRLLYANSQKPTKGIWYDSGFKAWYAAVDLNASASMQWGKLISERTALRRLGHLPYPRKGMVPEKVIPSPGMLPAVRRANNS